MKLDKPINILVQRRSAIGDVVMTTGVVRELKARYGDNAQIDIGTDCLGVYRNNPHVRNIIPVDQLPNVGQWDIHYNLDDAYEVNPVDNYVDNYFYRVFGTTDMDKHVELFPTDSDLSVVQDFQTNNELDTYIVVHMRNWHWQAKNIDMAVWLDIYGKLFEETADFKIVCVGGQTDHVVDHPLFVDARDKFDVQQLKVLCDGARAFVGIDSAPYWSASASSTKLIALLTHLRPEVILPFRTAPTIAIQTSEACAGCNDRQQRPVRQIVCAKTNYPCINNFNTDQIAKEILKQLG
jgi:ADP-heptose:LPS heptosyltransferase